MLDTTFSTFLLFILLFIMHSNCTVDLNISSIAKLFQFSQYNISHYSAYVMPYTKHCARDFRANTIISTIILDNLIHVWLTWYIYSKNIVLLYEFFDSFVLINVLLTTDIRELSQLINKFQVNSQENWHLAISITWFWELLILYNTVYFFNYVVIICLL